jgi:hypothetical protein
LPSLFRFLFVLGLLAALVYGGMIALVAFVKVQPREMTQTVNLPKPPKAIEEPSKP